MRANFSFSLTPSEAVDYLQDKGFKQTFFYDEMMHDAHHKAFTVAKIMRNDLLEDMRDSLAKALKEGVGFEEWKKNITPTLKKYGWYGVIDTINPQTGEIKTINVNSRRLSTIYHTNMRVSHAVARYERMMALPFSTNWMYQSAMLKNSRPTHKAKHGTILPRDDAWWETNYPPNGWGCKCKVVALSDKEVEKQGLSISSRPENIASKDWDYHVGKRSTNKSLYKDNLSKLQDKELTVKAKEELKEFDKKATLAVARKQLHEMIDEMIVKNNVKYPTNFIQVGLLSSVILTKVQNILETELEHEGVLLHKNDLYHARPQRKEAYNQALGVEEMRQIVDVIDEAKDVFVDVRDDFKAIIYTFEDKEDKEKINKIVVDINHVVKKFGKTNAIITMGKINKVDIEKSLKDGVFAKIE